MRAPRVDAEAALAAHARRRSARSRISKTRPKRSSSSSCHCSSTDGGAATTIVFAFLRSSSSRAIRPASIVLPRPTSSAMNRLTRGQAQRLAQRLQLVGVDLDAGAERRLEEVRVGGRDAVPAERVEVGGEQARGVEALGGEVVPAPRPRGSPVELVLPETSSGWPWASSSTQARRTSGDCAVAGATTSSTSQRRERTWTSSPDLGRALGKGFSDGHIGRVGKRTRCRASGGAPDRAAYQLLHPRHVSTARPHPYDFHTWPRCGRVATRRTRRPRVSRTQVVRVALLRRPSGFDARRAEHHDALGTRPIAYRTDVDSPRAQDSVSPVSPTGRGAAGPGVIGSSSTPLVAASTTRRGIAGGGHRSSEHQAPRQGPVGGYTVRRTRVPDRG